MIHIAAQDINQNVFYSEIVIDRLLIATKYLKYKLIAQLK